MMSVIAKQMRTIWRSLLYRGNNRITRAVARHVWARDRAPRGGLLECDIQNRLHIPNHVTRTCMGDTSGRIEYRFNEAGYRGELPDPQAKIRICLIGESDAFGLGVAYEDCFAHGLKSHFAQATGLTPDEINIVNLSASGASSDYCLRSLVRQFDHIQPHFVLYFAPTPNRIEHNTPEGNANYAIHNIDLDKLDTAPIAVQGFVDLYDPVWGFVNWAKNLLLFQCYCSWRQTEYLAITQASNWMVSERPSPRNYTDQIDQSRVLNLLIKPNQPDFAEDRSHFGPKTHALAAIAIFDKCAELLCRMEQFPWRAKMAKYAEVQRSQNADWQLVNKKWR